MAICAECGCKFDQNWIKKRRCNSCTSKANWARKKAKEKANLEEVLKSGQAPGVTGYKTGGKW